MYFWPKSHWCLSLQIKLGIKIHAYNDIAFFAITEQHIGAALLAATAILLGNSYYPASHIKYLNEQPSQEILFPHIVNGIYAKAL